MTIDQKAFDVAVESLRPLFREPVSYLEQAAKGCITTYLAALPPPAGEVGEIVEALRKRAFRGPTIEAVHLRTIEWKAADALAAQSAKLAEAERYAERLAVALAARHYPEADMWRPLSGNLLGLLTQIDNMTSGLSRTARAERAEAALREIEMLRYGDETFLTDANKAHNIARAALSPPPPPRGA